MVDITHMPVAVLCAARNSIYKEFAGVEVYDEVRDARSFAGGMPVVAHPPCRAWSAHCSHQAKPLPGEKDLAPMCVEWIKTCGGVLEHPANSKLWKHMNLPEPGVKRNGLWTVPVLQSWWGDARSKKTWLLVSGVDRLSIPMRPHDPSEDTERWNSLSKNKRSATPVAFARWLVEVARFSSVGCDVLQ